MQEAYRTARLENQIRGLAAGSALKGATKGPIAALTRNQLSILRPKGGWPEGGISAAARELRVAESKARRAIKAETITDAGAAAIIDLGLANNQSAYLAVASEATAEAHAAKARELAGQTIGNLLHQTPNPVNASSLFSWRPGIRRAPQQGGTFLTKIGRRPHGTGAAALSVSAPQVAASYRAPVAQSLSREFVL